MPVTLTASREVPADYPVAFADGVPRCQELLGELAPWSGGLSMLLSELSSRSDRLSSSGGRDCGDFGDFGDLGDCGDFGDCGD